MLLAFDVGNTTITLGVFQGRKLRAQTRIPTHGPLALRAALVKLKTTPGSIDAPAEPTNPAPVP